MDAQLPDNRANRRFLYVDMNSFFASCEQADNPDLQGKPVITIPTKNSCALSASYEAKKFGIRTGTSEKEARFLCPKVQVVYARPKVYMDYHEKLVAILNDLTPNVTVRSVDEASIRLCRNEDPWELGQIIKQRLWEISPALNCSVGIGPNLFASKLATEIEKPNGLVEIRLEDLPNIYEKVTLRDLCGIARGMERQLNRLNIYTVTDFYHAEADFLRENLGVIGYRWWLQLHGYPSYEFSGDRKSLSHSHVLPPQYRHLEAAKVTMKRLVAKIGRRLRREGYMAGHIALYLRFVDQTKGIANLIITPASDTLTLVEHVERLWEMIDPTVPVLKISIWTHNLTPMAGIPYPLFPAEQKRLHLARALDRINDRHGVDTIRFAVLDTKGSRAPDRIAFSSLFKIEHE